jgi:hypothetical protein
METKFDYRENYANQLAQAEEFQDFWCEYLWKRECLAICNFSSKKYQYKIGENLQGFEFKQDNYFKKTNNLWIETEERSSPNKEYVKSGIYRPDNAWMYCIGNYSTLYIFSKKGLCKLSESNHITTIENRIKTSIGYLLSKDLADHYCAKKIII